MITMIRFGTQRIALILFGACLLTLGGLARDASAITPIPTPTPQAGSYGLEATKVQPPPKQGASITTPASGASFSKSPITVNGICPKGLLVQIYDNGVMVGSLMCTSGSFSIQVSLFSGKNDLTTTVYDDLDQAGPTSKVVTVTYSNTHLSAFGQLVTLTSSYGRRSANAGTQLAWPFQLSGGAGPYAFSIDWGDSSKPELKSQALAGVVTLAHAYSKAGIYRVNLTATDHNGVSAFLQVVAVSNGEVGSTAATGSGSNGAKGTKVQVLWAPSAIALIMLVPTYLLGRRSQLVTIRNKMLKERDSYEKK